MAAQESGEEIAARLRVPFIPAGKAFAIRMDGATRHVRLCVPNLSQIPFINEAQLQFVGAKDSVTAPAYCTPNKPLTAWVRTTGKEFPKGANLANHGAEKDLHEKVNAAWDYFNRYRQSQMPLRITFIVNQKPDKVQVVAISEGLVNPRKRGPKRKKTGSATTSRSQPVGGTGRRRAPRVNGISRPFVESPTTVSESPLPQPFLDGGFQIPLMTDPSSSLPLAPSPSPASLMSSSSSSAQCSDAQFRNLSPLPQTWAFPHPWFGAHPFPMSFSAPSSEGYSMISVGPYTESLSVMKPAPSFSADSRGIGSVSLQSIVMHGPSSVAMDQSVMTVALEEFSADIQAPKAMPLLANGLDLPHLERVTSNDLAGSLIPSQSPSLEESLPSTLGAERGLLESFTLDNLSELPHNLPPVEPEAKEELPPQIADTEMTVPSASVVKSSRGRKRARAGSRRTDVDVATEQQQNSAVMLLAALATQRSQRSQINARG